MPTTPHSPADIYSQPVDNPDDLPLLYQSDGARPTSSTFWIWSILSVLLQVTAVALLTVGAAVQWHLAGGLLVGGAGLLYLGRAIDPS